MVAGLREAIGAESAIAGRCYLRARGPETFTTALDENPRAKRPVVINGGSGLGIPMLPRRLPRSTRLARVCLVQLLVDPRWILLLKW